MIAGISSLRTIALWMLIPSIIVSLTAATPLSGYAHQSVVARDDINPPAIEEGACQTDRSEDYYGLGVRMGIYLAWIQGWVAFNFVPSEIGGALDTNSIFLFAVVVAMVRCTITRLIMQIDALILMHLGAGTIFSVMSIWGYRTSWYVRDGPTKGISHFGGFGTHMRLLLCVAFASYGLFFWMNGINGPEPGLIAGTGHDEDNAYCTPLYTFMFSRIRADGGIRIFYIIMTIGTLCYYGTQLIVSSLAAYARPMKMYKLAKAGQWRTTSRLDYATGFSYKQLYSLFIFLRWGNLAWIIFSMITVEFTLNYNRMYEVLGWRGHLFFPSQLIPFIIGVCGLFKVIYAGYEHWRNADDTDPSLVADAPISPLRKETRPHGIEALKMFSPKTMNGDGFSQAGKLKPPKCHHKNSELDPLLDGQPLWLRCLVAYLPWLVLVRWWHLKDRDYEQTVYANAVAQVSPTDTTQKHQSWDSGRSTVRSPETPASPRNHRAPGTADIDSQQVHR